MSDTHIDLLDDNCLLEIFERLPLLDQICASKVCRRWKILCPRFFKRVYALSSNGNTWRCRDKDETILTTTADSEAVKTVLENCSKYIQKLKVNGKHIQRDPSNFQLIMGLTAARCENIRFMDFEQLYDLIILTLIPIIIRRNKHLESLKLRGVYGLNMYVIFQDLPKSLSEFHILNLIPMDSNALIELLRSCQSLESFECDHVPDIVAKLIGSQKQLKHLRMKRTFTIPASFNHIAQLKNLVHLDLEKSTDIRDENLVNIAHNCQQLQTLIICLCNKITDTGISSLANLERLTDLRISELNEITDASIAILPVTLQVLYCCGCVGVLDIGVIQLLTRATDLQELHINRSQITNITMEAAIRIVKDQESNRNLKIYAENSRANLGNIDETLIAELPPLLQLYLE